MRHILLATTAFLALATAAQAATSPITVNLGGTADFVAGAYSESNRGEPASYSSSNHDFETLYDLNVTVTGKAGNGLQYGGLLGLGNGPDIQNGFSGNSDNPYFNNGYLWMSGAFGKLQLGDSHGATDIVVGSPTVGEGQVNGRFIDFLDTTTFAKNFVTGVDATDHSTNITYFTPKIGDDSNKAQLGVSYIPQFYNYGGSVVTLNSGHDPIGLDTTNTYSPYHDVVKAALAYTGKLDPVAISASAHVISGSSSYASAGNGLGDKWLWNAPAGTAQHFTAWGVGAQGALDGFTLGGSYLNQGHYDTVAGQNKLQEQVGAALKYEFNKLGVGVSYLGGKGYANMLYTAATANTETYDYVKDYTSFGAGGSYTWAPGLTSNLDGVYFDQKTEANLTNQGYVLLVSQKLAF